MTIANLFDCLMELSDSTIITVKGLGEKISCEYKDLSPAIREMEVENAHFETDCNGEVWTKYFTVILKK